MESAFSVALFVDCIYQTLFLSLFGFLCICASLVCLIVHIEMDSSF